MVAFKDATSTWEYRVDSDPDYTFGICDSNDADLGNFFSRPVKIQSYSWGTGTTLFENFRPWSDYFNNPRVLNRISNYNLLRAKLHLKFVINGNGFHYGRAIASYLPLPDDDDFATTRSFFPQDLIAASQRPHVYLDPTLSQGGDMILPFFWQENALNIPRAEWSAMGEVFIQTIQGLKHANGANDSVTISVFAWAEDVSLAVPTSVEPGTIVPQAQDEYGTGPISRPASVVAKAAGALRDAPIIGPYARATEIAASATSAVATNFGFSRPAILDSIVPYRPTAFGNVANTNMPDSTTKLTTDAKQELTVDSRTTGLAGTDEMTIKSIAARESYITQFPWTVANAAEDALFQIEVTPQVWDANSTLALPEIHLPACAFATLPFENWRGTMRYRFQIVSSAYHKGRLKIVYDPYAFASNEYNTNYTYIVDIAEDKDFTVDIGWGNAHPWAQVSGPGRLGDLFDPPFENGPTTPSSPPLRRANGVLRVYVVNELTIPNSTINNDVAINVFISAGEDLCVANPNFRIDDYSYFNAPSLIAPQGEDEMQATDQDTTDEPSKPMNQETDHLMLARQDNATAYDHVFFGETITSFRALLKRYNRAYFTTTRLPSANTVYLTRVIRRAFPPYRGFAPGGEYSTAQGDYNYGNMTLLNYLTPAYVGWRGSLRYKVGFIQGATSTVNSVIVVNRLPGSGEGTSADATVLSTINPVATLSVLQEGLVSTASGAHATATDVNPILEFEMPYAEAARFSPARRADVTSGHVDFFDTAFALTTITRSVNPSAASSVMFDYHTAAGEDFSHFFYIGPPILYLRGVAPSN
jgi:hypothetical protein